MHRVVHPTLFLVLSLVLAAACAPKQLPIAQIDTLHLEDDAGHPDLILFCANAQPPLLDAVVTLSDGSTRSTRRHGGLPVDEIEIAAEIPVRNEHGRIRVIAPEPLVTLHKDIALLARLKRKPEVEARALLRPRYDCPTTIHASGPSGRAGKPGQDGSWAPNGRVAGYSPVNSQPALEGVPGGDGAAGTGGGSASSKELSLGVVDTPRGRLGVARLRANGKESFVLFDPKSADLTLDASGGAGGAVGRGGDGGRGADGTQPLPPLCEGRDGGPGADGGHGGNGGNGGDGGAVKVRVDRDEPSLLDKLHLVNDGGKGGAAGPGGAPGAGGSGGPNLFGSGCPATTSGRPGTPGTRGIPGEAGADGHPGPKPEIVMEAGVSEELSHLLRPPVAGPFAPVVVTTSAAPSEGIGGGS